MKNTFKICYGIRNQKCSTLYIGYKRTMTEGDSLAIILTMFAIGVLLGFVGAGGSGFIIAILNVLFHIPIHTALGTSLTAMTFTTLSGAYSHYRQGNVATKIGVIVGLFGAAGSFIGSKISSLIPAYSLHWLTGGMLLLSSLLLLLRLVVVKNISEETKKKQTATFYIFIKAALLGIISGILAGAFGIGSTPFIQLGLLIFLGLSVRQSVGTTMLIILPIAIGGGLGYRSEGYLDFVLLLQVLMGTMTGAYIGAKFTNLAPKILLKSAMILTPAAAGIVLLF
jgi:uncharacterized membrane protein YfcA